MGKNLQDKTKRLHFLLFKAAADNRKAYVFSPREMGDLFYLADGDNKLSDFELLSIFLKKPPEYVFSLFIEKNRHEYSDEDIKWLKSLGKQRYPKIRQIRQYK